MKWLDKLFGRAPRYDDEAMGDEAGQASTTLHELVEESHELGRQMDALRERRIAIRKQIDAMLAAKPAAAPGRRDAVVHGQVIDVKAEH